MISSVRGVVQTVGLDSAVVEVGGVGLLVRATPTTLGALRPGSTAALSTSLVIREDAFTLYGFADAEERDVFEIVQTVGGVGPRLALAMLAVHSPDALRRAVATEDLAALTRVPGIGRKGAQRIVLELADRLGVPSSPEAPDPSAGQDGRRAQVLDALVGLGWTAKVAEDALSRVLPEQDGGGAPVEDVATVLRSALRVLGGGRG